MKKNTPTILVFVDYYLPGYKAGGPLRSVANLIDRLGGAFNFKIVTRDRDLGDYRPYPDIKADTWNSLGSCDVYYCSPHSLTLSTLARIISATSHDILYLNSFFSPVFTIKPLLLRRLGLIPQKKLVLAPRGEFPIGALNLKGFKKRIFLSLAKALQLFRDVTWQASSVLEKEDILRNLSLDLGSVMVAPDLPGALSDAVVSREHQKQTGNLKAIFISRISPKKNLDGALSMLNGIKGNITFNIYGPIEDTDYWEKCQKLCASLPDNIEVQYRGAIANEQVAEVLAQHDLLFFPTHGENFGHIILEAFAAGCPVLISDQTPWQNLEEMGVGWNPPLNRADLYKEALQECLEMNQASFELFSDRAKQYCKKIIQDELSVEQNRQLFNSDSNS